MYVIPAIDILDGRVVRLHQGRYDEVTVYAEDPAAQLRNWADQGAELVHVVDLAGARDGVGDPTTWRALGETGVPFQLGGGIRTLESAEAVIAAGAARVVLGTAAVWAPNLAAEIVASLGADRVVAAVDVRGGKATGAGWLDEGRELAAVLGDLSTAGVVRALVTGIATDGTLAGPDLALLERSIELAPDLALIASGGVGSLSDISTVARLGVEAVIVGKALYANRFSYAEAMAAAVP